MPLVIFEMPDGTRLPANIPAGESVMRGAVNIGVPGIQGECSDQLTCATCHVYVAAEWFDRFPPPDDAEADLLEVVDHPQRHSRLSCQLVVDDRTDGALVQVPGA